jgi:hypothetical protein
MSNPTSERLEGAMNAVRDELSLAMAKHPAMTNAHEAYAIILEELDEFWAEVKSQGHQRSPEKMREELLQTAAMAIRAIVDLKL